MNERQNVNETPQNMFGDAAATINPSPVTPAPTPVNAGEVFGEKVTDDKKQHLNDIFNGAYQSMNPVTPEVPVDQPQVTPIEQPTPVVTPVQPEPQVEPAMQTVNPEVEQVETPEIPQNNTVENAEEVEEKGSKGTVVLILGLVILIVAFIIALPFINKVIG